MDPQFKKGYLLYEKNELTPALVCPHSGPAITTPIARDDHSETIAFQCWKELGGKLIISSLPRTQVFGIDFNRDIPPKNLSIDLYHQIVNEPSTRDLMRFKKKYAWLAKDEDDYYKRLNIYQNFWSEAEESSHVLLYHKSFTKMKAIPSILDIIPIKGKKTVINSIIHGLNKKYEPFLRGIERDFKQAVLIETKRTINRIVKKYGKFDINLIEEDTNPNFRKDINNMLKYANRFYIKKLKDKWNIANYLETIKSALRNSPHPNFTMAHVHDATLAHGPKRKLLISPKKLILELEINAFVGYWYSEKIAEIIKDLYKYLY